MASTSQSASRLNTTALWLVGLPSAVIYLWMNEQGAIWLRLLIKPLPVLCLAIWVGLGSRNRYGRRITAGLLMALTGDVFLIFPGETAFLGGLVFNLLAHLCFIAAFLSAERTLRPLRALPFVIWVGTLYGVLFPHLGGMKIPVLLYSLAITSMMWRAAVVVGHPTSTRLSQWAGLLGAMGFALCDSIIALNRFHHPITYAQQALMISYWLGQLGLSRSAFRGDPAPQAALAPAAATRASIQSMS